jgi:hypothetical protein
MIHLVHRRFRSLVVLLLAAVAAVAVPTRAHAADSEWFDPSRPPPMGPGAPAPPSGPAGPPPLAPSPLLDDGSAAEQATDQNPEALTKFRPYLDPYGTWLDDPTYGRVWIPNANVVGPNFQPYVSNGRWALDESNEWIWVSDYPFGWVVFHYGRWVWIPNAGWGWIPGYQYSPAWVTWRVPTGDYGYVGWAPAPPTFVWFGGAAIWWGYNPYYWWVFCPSPYLFHYGVGYYVVTDPYWQGYAASTTRPYVPASPRPHAGASPTAAARRSPSLSAARIPPSALPASRVSSRPDFSSARPSLDAPSGQRYSTRADSPTRSTFDPSPSRSFQTSRSRDVRLPSVSSRRLAPVRAPSRAMPNMRAAPHAMRPSRR